MHGAHSISALPIWHAGFADWLRLQLARAAQQLPPAAPLLLPDEAAALEAAAAGHLPVVQPAATGHQQDGGAAAQRGAADAAAAGLSKGHAAEQVAQQQRAAALLSWAVEGDAWLHSSRLEAAVQGPLLRLAAWYLLRERRRWAGRLRERCRMTGGRRRLSVDGRPWWRAPPPLRVRSSRCTPHHACSTGTLPRLPWPLAPCRGLSLDPVANFHLRNGASVLRLNWRADTSAAGLARSHSLMVNYEYQLDQLADNNRKYLVRGIVGAAPGVRVLLREETA